MKTMRILILCTLLLGIANPVVGQSPKTGLYFYAHDQNLDKRTSLSLNAGQPYSLASQDNFSLEFDILLRDELVKFGYVFRVVSDAGENFDLVINNIPNILLVIGNQDFPLKTIPVENVWNHLKLSFDKRQNRVLLRFNDELIDCPHNLQAVKSLNISFGQSHFDKLGTTDVSPFILKQIAVSTNDKPVHRWLLDKHGNDVVYDELNAQIANVSNPNWMIDHRSHWKLETSLEASVFPQITFDPIGNKLYILNGQRMLKYSLQTGTQETFENTRHLPADEELCNSLLLNPLTGDLLHYAFTSLPHPTNSLIINKFDTFSNRWIRYNDFAEDSDHAHHNRYISPHDSCLYLFGGYGHYKYNSDFHRINLKTKAQTSLNFSHTITPRYLAAMGGNSTGNKLYILGGRGAEMGRQELSPQNFADLYEVDLKTDAITHLLDLPNNDNLYSNSLVMAENDSCIYYLTYSNLTYATSITLNKLNIYTQQVEKLADNIDFYFRDITSFCDLYYSPSLSKLVAIASHSNDQKTAMVNVYTLDFPPLQLNDALQEVPKQSGSLFLSIFIILILVLVLGIFRKKLFVKKSEEAPLVATQELTTETPPATSQFYDLKTKAIVFLGGFQVFDKEGKNITGEFTPTLKHILVLIILYTLKNNKGISSTKLQEILWFDKSEDAARNNRSVNIRKLRMLLQGLGKVDIDNENSYWTIALADGILCDYWEALRLLHKMQEEKQNAKEDLLHLLELLNAGVMLPNIQFEWVDEFKTNFSNEVIDTMMQVVNNPKNTFHNNLDISLKIADCLLKIDTINEDALGMKIKALSAMGKKGLAKSVFDSFAKEYKALLGETYRGSLNHFFV
ncbi:hypothetical protein AGMMS4957_00260 [Bacteroidia bacterium]|nr:hypothetical protein AGMMS4957_00260 [Bacteroidia bacterium]